MPAFDGLAFYAKYAVPATVLAQQKIPGKKGLGVALTLLAALASYQLRTELDAMPPNFYVMLGTDRGATPGDVKKAFRSASLRYHPDKDPSAAAAAQFAKLADAHKVLGSADASVVRAYDLHGAEAALAKMGTAREKAISKEKAKRAAGGENPELRSVISIFAFHIVWAVLAFLMSALLHGAASSRDVLFSGHLLATVAEISLQYQGLVLPASLVARVTVFEQVALLRALIPPFTLLCVLVGAGTFVDGIEAAAQLQRDLLDSNKELLVSLGELKSEIASSAGGGGGGGGGKGSAAAAALAALNDDDATSAGLANLKTAGVQPRRGKMDRVKASDGGAPSGGTEAQATQAATPAAPQPAKDWSFFHVVMAIYAVKYVYENFIK